MTKKLRRLFPRLFGGQYRITSNRTRRYNCLAWAAGNTSDWWDAGPGGVWPEGIPDDGSVQAAIALFERLGYTRTAEAGFEQGVLKIAIYGNNRGYTHAARQEGTKWSSKLGSLQDVGYDTLENLIGTRYGAVIQVMEKRPNPASPPAST